MTCSRIQNLLSAYIDKELNKEDYFKVRTHLTTCSICDKAYEELMEIKELFDNINTIEPPEDMWLNIRTTILTGDLIAVQNTPKQNPWWNIAFNLLKVIVPAAVIGIIIALPMVSQITGINVSEKLFKNQPTIDEITTNEVQIADQDDTITMKAINSPALGYTPASNGITPFGNSTMDMSEDSFYLGHDSNNIIINDIITFFNSVYGHDLAIELEIIN